MQFSCNFVNTEKAENKATLRSDLNAVCRITRWRTADIITAVLLLQGYTSTGYPRVDKPQGSGDRVPYMPT